MGFGQCDDIESVNEMEDPGNGLEMWAQEGQGQSRKNAPKHVRVSTLAISLGDISG
jgi:hypothetical protein